MTVYSGQRQFSCSAEASVHQPDENFEYHFAVIGKGIDNWVSNLYDKRSHELIGEYHENKMVNYTLMIDSHIPFYIKRYDIPVYYMYADAAYTSKTRYDTSITVYAVCPYIRRNGGLAVGSANYRMRLFLDAKVRSNTEYGDRDSTVKFDDIIICPCSSSVKSQWSSDDGSYIYLHDNGDSHIQISDHATDLYLDYRDNVKLDAYLAASPYDFYSKLGYVYYGLDVRVGEITYGEKPIVEACFGSIDTKASSEYDTSSDHTYHDALDFSSAGINFGNNPLFTGTYNEYRTYIEQTYGG